MSNEAEAIVDTDVIIKCACYGLLSDVNALLASGGQVGVLGATRYVATSRIAKSPASDPGRAQSSLKAFLATAVALEPTPTELATAVRIEDEAARNGLELDAGESQLLSILLQRALRLLVTGDKRAISAIETLARADKTLQHAAGRLACLEQVILHVAQAMAPGACRAQVCAEPRIDKALTSAFSCHSTVVAGADFDGLNSYIDDLRRSAPTVLCAHDVVPSS